MATKPEPTGTAVGDLMVTDLPRVDPHQTVADCLRELAGYESEGAELIAVVDGERAIGLVPPGRLVTSTPDLSLRQLMEPVPEPVNPSSSIEPAAARMVHRGEVAVVVADDGGSLIGVVPAGRLVTALLAEHEEDVARLGGYRAGSRSALRAAEEPLGARLWHRLPWLIVGLAGAMLSVLMIGAFEEQLDRVVLLAFFVPAVVYMSSAIGTQTQTLLIRALAADVDLRKVFRKELWTGLLLGIAVAALFYPFALIGWGNAEVALAVSLALLASCSIATAIGMGLPLLLRRLGFDPAFGSGPLATVIQDLLTIVIYFAIGVPLAT